MATRDAIAAHDLEGKGALNFDEYCAMVKVRAPDLQHSTSNLQQRFQIMHPDVDGHVSIEELMLTSMIDKLGALHTRAIELFRSWDEDHSGSISKGEFRKALKALGFHDASTEDLDAVFDKLDSSGRGELIYKDLSNLIKEVSKRKALERQNSLTMQRQSSMDSRSSQRASPSELATIDAEREAQEAAMREKLAAEQRARSDAEATMRVHAEAAARARAEADAAEQAKEDMRLEMQAIAESAARAEATAHEEANARAQAVRDAKAAYVAEANAREQKAAAQAEAARAWEEASARREAESAAREEKAAAVAEAAAAKADAAKATAEAAAHKQAEEMARSQAEAAALAEAEATARAKEAVRLEMLALAESAARAEATARDETAARVQAEARAEAAERAEATAREEAAAARTDASSSRAEAAASKAEAAARTEASSRAEATAREEAGSARAEAASARAEAAAAREEALAMGAAMRKDAAAREEAVAASSRASAAMELRKQEEADAAARRADMERERVEREAERRGHREVELQAMIESTVSRLRQAEISEQVHAAEKASRLLELARRDAEDAKIHAAAQSKARKEEALWAAQEMERARQMSRVQQMATAQKQYEEAQLIIAQHEHRRCAQPPWQQMHTDQQWYPSNNTMLQSPACMPSPAGISQNYTHMHPAAALVQHQHAGWSQQPQPSNRMQSPQVHACRPSATILPNQPLTAEQELQQLIDAAEEAANRYSAVRSSASKTLARSSGEGLLQQDVMPPPMMHAQLQPPPMSAAPFAETPFAASSSAATPLVSATPLSFQEAHVPPQSQAPQLPAGTRTIEEVGGGLDDAASYLALSQQLVGMQQQLRMAQIESRAAAYGAEMPPPPPRPPAVFASEPAAAEQVVVSVDELIARKLDLRAVTATPVITTANGEEEHQPNIPSPTSPQKCALSTTRPLSRAGLLDTGLTAALPDQDRAYAEAFASLEADRQRHVLASAATALYGSERRPSRVRETHMRW